MTLTVGFFYLFAILAVASAAMVIIAKNPVHAILFLILAFFNAAGLFILLGAEFLAMLLVIVYVGAVAVLFIKNAPAGLLVGGLVLAELVALFVSGKLNVGLAKAISSPIPDPATVGNTKALGLLLYTKYVYLFQAAGLILLVAMIGAIVLTHRGARPGVRRQNISVQNARTPATAMDVIKVPSGGTGMPPTKPKVAAKAKAEAAE
jgi:NADH-quinone oxidoreductase subunit J